MSLSFTFLSTDYPKGYEIGDDGYYYKLYAKKKNWADAQDVCKKDGANLPIIWDKKTNNVVRSKSGGDFDVWIGASDQWKEGTWETPLRNPITFKQWSHGQPNNGMGIEDCAIQIKSSNWFDDNCKKKKDSFASGNQVRL